MEDLRNNVQYLKTSFDKIEERIKNLTLQVNTMIDKMDLILKGKQPQQTPKEFEDLNKTIDQLSQKFSQIKVTTETRPLTKKKPINFLMYNLKDYKEELNKK